MLHWRPATHLHLSRPAAVGLTVRRLSQVAILGVPTQMGWSASRDASGRLDPLHAAEQNRSQGSDGIDLFSNPATLGVMAGDLDANQD